MFNEYARKLRNFLYETVRRFAIQQRRKANAIHYISFAKSCSNEEKLVSNNYCGKLRGWKIASARRQKSILDDLSFFFSICFRCDFLYIYIDLFSILVLSLFIMFVGLRRHVFGGRSMLTINRLLGGRTWRHSLTLIRSRIDISHSFTPLWSSLPLLSSLISTNVHHGSTVLRILV